MSGFFSPAAAKMSITPSEATAFETSWRTAGSSSSARLAPRPACLGQAGADGLEEADLVADRQGVVVRDGQGEGLRQLGDRLQEAGPCPVSAWSRRMWSIAPLETPSRSVGSSP